jgi:hypothetical protein
VRQEYYYFPRSVHLVTFGKIGTHIHSEPAECKEGEMIHFRYDFKSHGVATPITDLSGNISYAASMMYDCNKCSFTCKGNDGKLYSQFKPSISKAYPVDPQYASSNQVHLDITATCVMENSIVTNGNGNQISRLVHQMRANKYEDLQEIFSTRVIDENIKLDIAPPTFLLWFGKYGWSGDQFYLTFVLQGCFQMRFHYRVRFNEVLCW